MSLGSETSDRLMEDQEEQGGPGFVNGFSGRNILAENDEAPPPPYESVVMNDVGSSDFQITIADPHKVGEGMKSHISYRVLTKTTMKNYVNKEPVVLRRFRDFAWLHSRLCEQNRGIIVPPLPEKNAMEKYITHSASFVETRRRALQVYINRVAAHPALRGSRDLQNFLEATEDEWATEMGRASYESSGSSKTLGSTMQLIRNVQRSAVNLVYSKSDDDEEDHDYVKVREYIFQLEAHLSEVHKQAARLIKRQAELGASLSEFGVSMVALGKFESEALAAAFQRLGEKADVLSRAAQEQAADLAATFEAPLKEFVQMVKSAKAVVADRSSALTNWQSARQEVEARRSKLTKLRGTPGNKEERVAEVERELNEATRRVEETKAVYMTICTRMSEELARFQQERAAEMHSVLLNFAMAEAQLAADTGRTWRQLLPSEPRANGAH